MYIIIFLLGVLIGISFMCMFVVLKEEGMANEENTKKEIKKR